MGVSQKFRSYKGLQRSLLGINMVSVLDNCPYNVAA